MGIMKSWSYSSAVKLRYQVTPVISDLNLWQEELKKYF